MRRLITLVGVGFLCLAVGSISGGPIDSPPSCDFDDGTLQGWTGMPTFNGDLYNPGTGGNPDGYMETDDTVQGGGTLRVIAPTEFTGDLTVYGGIEWDEYLHYPTSSLPTFPVLVGADGTRYRERDFPIGSGGVWRTRFVPFHEDHWELFGTGGTASFQEVLQNVVELQMNTETYPSRGPECGIDNIHYTPYLASHDNHAPSGMPDFDQRQDRWAHEILCGVNLTPDTLADPVSDDVQLLDPNTPCVSADDPVVGKGPDHILQTVAHVDDDIRWDWCAPTAIANALWWLDSRYGDPNGVACDGADTYGMVTSYPAALDDHCENNVDDPNTPAGGVPPDVDTAFGELVEDLAWRMDTNAQRTLNPVRGAGTTAIDAQIAVQQYLKERGLEALYTVQLIPSPPSPWIDKAIQESRNLILFLAFDQYCNDEWTYLGGHAVTAAAGTSETVCVSDPFYDMAEAGGSGRVLPLGSPHAHTGPPEILHNDAAFISHDCYGLAPGPTPYGSVELTAYARTNPAEMTTCEDVANFAGQNVWDRGNPDFEPSPCDPACSVKTHVAYALEISPDFYWKAGDWLDYAPSGVPDFDQRSTGLQCSLDGSWSYCGPTAAANSLWWFDSKFEPSPVLPPAVNDNYPLVSSSNPSVDDHDPLNVFPLIQDLGTAMSTDANPGPNPCGTLATSMQTGLEQWLFNAGLDDEYYVNLMVAPTFDDVAAEVKKSQDVILLLGFWEDLGGSYQRLGGHYVTVAGVNDRAGLIGFSDPYMDAAELGETTGRVLGRPRSSTMIIDFDGPGRHLISLPRVITSPAITSSTDLYNALASAGLGPLFVERFDMSIDHFVGGYFPIDPITGQGYMVGVSTAGSLVLHGIDSTSPVPLYSAGDPGSFSGTNVISLPFSSPLNSAADLYWNDLYPNVISVSRYDRPTDSLMTYTGYAGTNFSIEPGVGYFVRMSWSMTYTPEAPDHNDAQNVSHDIYEVVPTSSPGGTWGPEGYADILGPEGLVNFTCQNLADDTQDCAPYMGGPVVAEVERAIEMSPCPDDVDGDTYRPICDNDCDDTNPDVYPGAAGPEYDCDGVNNDCDDPNWPDVPFDEVDNDLDGYPELCGDDCDDSDPTVYPDALQLCDGINNDCYDMFWPDVPFDEIDNDLDGFPGICGGDCNDDNPDEFPGQVWYPDCDGDGFYGAMATVACDSFEADMSSPCLDGFPPDGGWINDPGLDCDDENSLLHPLMPENIADGIDQNCDGVDDCFVDLDEDGYGTLPPVPDDDLDCTNDTTPYTTANPDDCDDSDPLEFPGQVWFADCDGDAYERATSVVACDSLEAVSLTPCLDALGPDGGWLHVAGTDCDDEVAVVYPGAPQVCDGLNNDCTHPSWPTLVNTNEYDDDLDTYSECAGDCDDTDPEEFPGQVWYADCDLDTFKRSVEVLACDLAEADSASPCTDGLTPDGGWLHLAGGDCDDEDPTEFPGQVWYADCDGDAYERAASVVACDLGEANAATPCLDALGPDGGWLHVAGGDCDDEVAVVYPGAPQVCDGLNNDCSHGSWPGLVNTNEYDDDGDTLSECDGDCDDANGIVWATPGEVIDLTFSNANTLSWNPPLLPGGTAPLYDTLRSSAAPEFVTGMFCVESDDASDEESTETGTPPLNSSYYYLIRAENACPIGQGPLGDPSSGPPRTGGNCP